MLSSAAQKNSKRIVFHWFRHGDLRLFDNPALVKSSQDAEDSGLARRKRAKRDACCVVPIFCFDSRILGAKALTPSGSLKCGPKRAKFLLESVADLRFRLGALLGSQLLVAHGEPAQIFDQLLSQLQDTDVSIFCQDEPAKEEKDAVKEVFTVMRKRPRGTVYSMWGSSVYDPKYSHFGKTLSDLPNDFKTFDLAIQKRGTVDQVLRVPDYLPFPEPNSVAFDAVSEFTTYMPTLSDLGYTDEQIELAESVDPRGVMEFHGGETAALQRLHEYIWDKELLKECYFTRNHMIGADSSTKFSPWLAHGCLSARHVVMECRRYQGKRVCNKSTMHVVDELRRRDFCKFFTVKHGSKVFVRGGTVGSEKTWSRSKASLEAWKEGRTGYPLVDACMRELKATGYMSARGRQNVASFLAHHLALDWRFGGDWFQSQLIDYDVYSNWVNWCSVAGMTGGRPKYTHIVRQSKEYDQMGDYVRLWLPELKDVPKEFVHEPWTLTELQQAEFNVRLGVDYPNPIVPLQPPPTMLSGEEGCESEGKLRKKKKGRPNAKKRARN